MRRRRLITFIANFFNKLYMFFKRKAEHAPKPPEEIQVIIPRQDFYDIWDQQLKKTIEEHDKLKSNTETIDE